MPTDVRLTPTSHIVLGLINALGECTPYDLKQVVAGGVGQIWWLHHAQLYSEPQRLAEAGYLSERRESGGRRRKHYEITEAGREVLLAWLAEPTMELTKIRYPSMLKLALGADPKHLAEAQLPGAKARLDEYETFLANLDQGLPRILRLLTEMGVEHQRAMVRYWTRLAKAKRSRSGATRPLENRLAFNSYFVLHLVKLTGKTTPYQLKRVVADPIWDFWTIPHAQLYSEPERLAEAGYLSERREAGGRRRKFYEITAAGREALREWLADPEPCLDELRDLAAVKLFFGAEPKPLARVQLPAHRDKLSTYEKARESLSESDKESSGLRTALEAGIENERIFIEFWERLIESGD